MVWHRLSQNDPKIIDFLRQGIYNTLMKQLFAITVKSIAFTGEREYDPPRGLCL
jgi:hypothetical protein